MSSKACKVCNLNESIPQRGETGNIITTVPCLITYIYCCEIVLMFYNVLNKHSMAAHHTLNNGRTLPLPYWVYLLLGRVNLLKIWHL
jgi:hypothetical protein